MKTITMQAASVKEEEQVRDETSGEMQHDGSASIEVPFDDTHVLARSAFNQICEA